MHNYELNLLPTPAQAETLTRLGRLQRGLAVIEELGALTALSPGANPEPSWAIQAVLCCALDDEIMAQMWAAVNQSSGRREALPQPALTGAGLVTPLSPGFVAVSGVPGPVAAATGDPQQLPAWARELLGREYVPAQPGTLAHRFPALQRAQRVDWADIRHEPHGWVLELEFDWDDYSPWALSWTELQDRPHDTTLRRLMG